MRRGPMWKCRASSQKNYALERKTVTPIQMLHTEINMKPIPWTLVLITSDPKTPKTTLTAPIMIPAPAIAWL